MSLVKLDSASANAPQSHHADETDSIAAREPSNTGLMSLGALDMLIPGYSSFAEVVAKIVGIDVASLVRLATLFYAVNKVYDLLIRGPLQDLLNEHFYSSITIGYHEELFDSLLAWYNDVISNRTARNQRIATYWDEEDEDEKEDRVNNAIDSQLTIFGLPASQTRTFDYSAWRADLPPPYEPDTGVYSFWYKRRYYTMTRARPSITEDYSHREYINLCVFGRSVEPVKHLLQEVIRHSISKKAAHTRVYTATDAGSDSYWETSGLKPTRPMSTVILNDDQKKAIVDDINSFLHPLSQKWYRSRAIPYRRGYLFHGPPGTGKSSLSLALAGLFRLHLYTLHLNSPKLTESGLADLFRCLPRRCIVLLEDIDDAGLKRESKTLPRSSKKNKDDDKGPEGISMSGLLNVIDGVGSQEGRILIMTSNYPENLDEAMLRSGRVDMKIQFTYATKPQVEALYMRMYEIDENAGMIVGGATAEAFFDSAKSTLGALQESETLSADPVERSRARSKLINARLAELAKQFAAKIPDEKIPPSDVQGYLLRYKTQPREAVDDADEFIKTAVENAERARLKREQDARDREAELKKLLEDEELDALIEREEREKVRREIRSAVTSAVPTPVTATPISALPAFEVADADAEAEAEAGTEPKFDSLFSTPSASKRSVLGRIRLNR